MNLKQAFCWSLSLRMLMRVLADASLLIKGKRGDIPYVGQEEPVVLLQETIFCIST